MKKILIICFGAISLNVIAQPIPVSSLGNVAYNLNENGTPIPTDNVTLKGGKVPFIANNNNLESAPQELPGFQPPNPTEEVAGKFPPTTIPSDISEIIKGKKIAPTVNETNNSSSSSNNSSSQGLTGVTLQTEPIVFSSTRGNIENWNKTTIEEHTKKGGELTQKRYEEFLNKK